MGKPLAQWDPVDAWSEFSPGSDGDWNHRRAAHLFRRAGFGADGGALETALKSSPADAVKALVEAREPAGFVAEMESLADTVVAGGEADNLSAWWMHRLSSTPAPLLEKTTLFWHGHFATSAEKVEKLPMMLRQNELLRQHALGDFTAMVQGISRDPAMLIYLDSATNRKAHPNENFARELMELFCLGEGNYSETDIRQLARCFTGWEIKRGRFRFNRFQHDFGEKEILGRRGKFGGEEGVRVVLNQKSAPLFIARKLVRYFVMDEPQPSDRLLKPLADQLRESEWNVSPVIARILKSRLFFSEHAIGRKVRSPVELLVGLLRCLRGSTDSYALAKDTADLGQALFFPPNVKGWDGGRAWINSSTLIGRANAIRRILNSPKTRFDRKPLAEMLDQQKVTEPRKMVDYFQRLLLATPLPQAVHQQLVTTASDSGVKLNERALRCLHRLASLPEFQLG